MSNKELKDLIKQEQIIEIKKKIHSSKPAGKVSRGTSISLSTEESTLICSHNREQLEIIGIKNSEKVFGNAYHLVTSVNIDTPIYKDALTSMEAYAKWIRKVTGKKCYIHVIPTFYRTNDPIYQNGVDPKIKTEYIKDGRLLLNGYAEVICDADVLITAVNPTGGYQHVGSTSTTLIPHPKLQDYVNGSIVKGDQRHILTTLSIAKPKYRRGSIGTKSEAEVIIGFTIIEPVVNSVELAPRHVIFDSDGCFNDIFVSVKNGIVKPYVRNKGMVLGDLHGIESDLRGLRARKDTIFSAPMVILHDFFSFTNELNHHEKAKSLSQRVDRTIVKEITQTKSFLKKFRKGYSGKIVLVDSNHDDSIDRFLDFQNPDFIPSREDLRLYHELSLFRFDHPNTPLTTHIFGLEMLDPEAKLGRYAVGHHGHKFGSSPVQIKSFVGDSILGHTHKSLREGNNIRVGHNIDMENKRPKYTRGQPYTWSVGDALVTPNGQAQLLRVRGNLYSRLHKETRARIRRKISQKTS